MGDTTLLKFGGREYNIPPLTIRQSRAIDLSLVKPNPPDPEGNANAAWDRMLGVISIALQPAYPDATPEKLADLPGTVDSVADAYRVVLGMLGLRPIKVGEAVSGEAGAGGAPAQE